MNKKSITKSTRRAYVRDSECKLVAKMNEGVGESAGPRRRCRGVKSSGLVSDQHNKPRPSHKVGVHEILLEIKHK